MPSLKYFPKGGHQNKQFHRRHINLCFMRAGAGEVLVYSFHSVNLFNWFHFEPDVRVSMKSPHSSGWLWGSFNANTKERYFVTISICPFQVYIEGRNRQNVRKYRAVCLSRVYCAWNCWSGGLIWARGLNARASHSYRGVWQTHPRGRSPVKARFEAPSLWMRKILRNTKSAEMELLQFCYMLLHWTVNVNCINRHSQTGPKENFPFFIRWPEKL